MRIFTLRNSISCRPTIFFKYFPFVVSVAVAKAFANVSARVRNSTDGTLLMNSPRAGRYPIDDSRISQEFLPSSINP